ncbi:MAG: hypothetical protein COB85_09290 [Bacteroidetes bacterium]|nr:MAG: hypothetical protein COB85_09290 [Bacteroidota bacterium]
MGFLPFTLRLAYSFIIVLLFTHFSKGQSDSLSKRRISIQLGTTIGYFKHESSTYVPSSRLTSRSSSEEFYMVFNPVMRFDTKNGNVQRVEWVRTDYVHENNKTTEVYDTISKTVVVKGERYRAFDISQRYEFDFIFLKRKKYGFRPFLGGYVIGYAFFSKTEPHTLYTFTTSIRKIGAMLSVVGGITYHFNERVYITLGIPILIGDFSIKQYITDNPYLPEKSRTNTTYDYDYRRNFVVELSLGVNLN